MFASVQTLARVRHLRQFAPDTFDYIVVDEFHHSATRTYRALIDYFAPRFLLGLTATPDRMDGGDLLGLCQENLVFRYDAFEGIEAGLRLAVPAISGATVDAGPTGFQHSTGAERTYLATIAPTALTGLWPSATQAAGASTAFEQHQRLAGHAGARTLAFCVSQRHADFMSG